MYFKITVVRTHLWLWTIYLRGKFKFGMGLVPFVYYTYMNDNRPFRQIKINIHLQVKSVSLI